ncbi:hypothetical protein BH23ACT8_BH23ACT8_15280 [soil metagenome]|jgi:putative cell wall-binding protein
MRNRTMVLGLVAALTLPLLGGTPADVAAHAQTPQQAQPEGRVGDAVVERVSGADRVGTSIAVSQLLHPETATAVVLARSDDFADALVGAPLAAQLGGPILLTAPGGLSPGVAEEVDRLEPAEVVLLGGESALSAEVEAGLGDRPVRRVVGADRFATAAAVAAELPASARVYLATGADFPDALAAAPPAAAEGAPILLTTRDALPPATSAAIQARPEAEEIVVLGGHGVVGEAVAAAAADGRALRRLGGSTRFETAAAVYDLGVAGGLDPTRLWLATGLDFPDALAAGPAIAALGETLLLVDGRDLCGVAPVVERLQANRDRLTSIRLLGGAGVISADAVDQLAAAADPDTVCKRLPRGGTTLFPDFRMVAYYGSSASPRLGVLGEGTPDEAAQRLLRQAAPYDSAERPILPAFEFIATVAQRAPGADGLYSTRIPIADILPYLEAARRIDAYLFLDFQPGRGDFPTQVRAYEELLREPDVGVALDPEWRMGPGQVPGETIGAVEAAEVNEVSAYLADLVDRHDLPEKLLVVHQFTAAMVRDRDQISDRPGLAVTFHIDGFGSRAAKRSKYDQLAVGPPFHNGLKLFYDEDIDIFAPHEAMAFDPTPDLITYQ